MPSRVVRCVFLCCAGLLIAAAPASAQRDLEIPIQFDFINPGARSLALGGAFIGLADDATAATTNPAGLQRLGRQEVSVEGRGWNFFTEFVQGGRLSGTATNIGIDTFPGPNYGETSERVGGISFLSYVYPRGRFSVAAYRQEASRLRASAVTDGAFFTEPNQFGQLQEFREYPSELARELDVVNYGGSVAYRFGAVSVGGGVNLSHLKLESALVAYELPSLVSPEFYGPAVYDEFRYGSTQTSDKVSVGFSGGVLVVPNDKFQFGAAYRRGASFDFDGQFVYLDPQFANLTASYTDEFKIPDNIGAGFAVRPFDGLTVALDVNRVTYSDLNPFIRAQVRLNEDEEEFYSIDDATEIHLGGEYVLTGLRFLPALRAGFWRESEHAVLYTGPDVLYQATAALAEATKHYAFGGGIAASQRLEINAGFDFSARANTMSFSAIVRF
jgi:long-chain fatty acid transport protein